jgi:hypothetical protein
MTSHVIPRYTRSTRLVPPVLRFAKHNSNLEVNAGFQSRVPSYHHHPDYLKDHLNCNMRDPLALPPAIALPLLQPLAHKYGLLTLPYHVHEILGSFLFYTSIFLLISPILSVWLFPDRYRQISRKTRISWHVRVVSTIQSTFICILALYIICVDQDRRRLGPEGRLWAYSGATGMVQAFAAGYFLWDVWISVQYISILGPSSLAHAVSALLITCLGFVSYSDVFCCSLPSL